MHRKRSFTTGLFSLLLALVVMPSLASAGWYDEVVEFEVAEDAFRFSFDEAPVFENGFPAYGNAFITQGYMYPKGTLSADSNGVFNGVNADGSPEFPELVIGEFTCRGWFVGDGVATVTGPWLVTHQLYDFNTSRRGKRTIATDGYELVDIGVVGTRAITGGTGRYKEAAGEAFQTLLGFNAVEGVALSFRLVIED